MEHRGKENGSASRAEDQEGPGFLSAVPGRADSVEDKRISLLVTGLTSTRLKAEATPRWFIELKKKFMFTMCD